MNKFWMAQFDKIMLLAMLVGSALAQEVYYSRGKIQAIEEEFIMLGKEQLANVRVAKAEMNEARAAYQNSELRYANLILGIRQELKVPDDYDWNGDRNQFVKKKKP